MGLLRTRKSSCRRLTELRDVIPPLRSARDHSPGLMVNHFAAVEKKFQAHRRPGEQIHHGDGNGERQIPEQVPVFYHPAMSLPGAELLQYPICTNRPSIMPVRKRI